MDTRAPTLLYEVDADGVALLTLNRPDKRNAFDTAMIEAWHQRLLEFATDERARVLVLTGAGKAFCAGGDNSAMEQRASQNGWQRKEYLMQVVHQIHHAMLRIDKPVIAAINGSARGAGLDMALMCDLRLMAASATVGETYIDIGLVAGNGGAWLLPRIVGVQRALELLWTGRLIEAQEAQAIGLVLRSLPDEQLLPEAMDLARRLAARPGNAVRMFKRSVYQGLELSLGAHLDMVSSHMSVLRDSDEYRQLMTLTQKKA
ncbi:enoyl-CoA hydratase/carnithine racemase [Paraburkholderia sp. WC7.3g]|uniref:Enoyl-CoA hydratase n=1 Tax=Paraburkholderia podalyriae TaxID=1938811 RepID=A0ABR7Q1F5_9BURK|nr:enoyl-CoA hydratase-related protein [Paraburkholderia podalyriae]MBC8752353.1 enoyl-CoA hydratase [Paraburkholderia podalyriae]